MAKAGRPFSEDPKSHKISARLTAAELEEFEAFAKRNGMTNAEVIKRGIKMQIDSEILGLSSDIIEANMEAYSLLKMDETVENLKKKKVSRTVDLGDFE